MAKVLKVAHTEFTVSDMDRTVAFWKDIMGGEIIEECYNDNDVMGITVLGNPDRPHAAFKVVKLLLGGHIIELFQYDDPVTKPFHGDPSVAGSAHLAFYVNDIRAFVDEIRGKGVKVLSDIQADEQDGVVKVLWVNVLDPDGIVVELYQDMTGTI